MKKKILYTLFVLSIFQYAANAQSSLSAESAASEKEVKQVIQNMFQAMLQADTSLLKTCFSDHVIIQTILNKPEGAVINTGSINDFLQSVGKQTPNAIDERIEFGAIQIEPLMATVWTPYTFYFKGQYSHKGVNSFQLVKLKEGWKIQYLIDTRYK